jgi:Transposase DDE domain
MFLDDVRGKEWNAIRQRGIGAFGRLLTRARLQKAAQRVALRVGSNPLNAFNLVWLGVVAAWDTSRNFPGVLGFTLKLLRDAPGGWNPPRRGLLERPRKRGSERRRKRSGRPGEGQRRLLVSEEAYVQARQRMPLDFWLALLAVLVDAWEVEHGPRACWNGFRVLALDGSEINLPRSRRLAQHFGTPRNQRGAGRPQARMVLLVFPLVRVPYRYTLVPRKISEKEAAAALLTDLRKDDLMLIDRGFFSYGLFHQITRQGAHFVTRKVATAQFRRLKSCGDKDQLVRWRPADGQWRRQGLAPETVLRVVDYQVPGFRPTQLVTSVLDPKRISREELVRFATQTEAGHTVDPGLYHRRWEIETTLCELKVRQKMEGGLRCRRPEGIQYEVAAHVLTYLLVRWLILEAAQQGKIDDPLRISYLEALRELREIAPAMICATPSRLQCVLLPRLLLRIAQHQVPLRPGRHFPRPSDGKAKNKGRGRKQLPAKLLRKAA